MNRGTCFVAMLSFACGASQAGTQNAPNGSLEPAAFLLEIGGASSLARPERSIEDLEAARRDARGTDRRQLSRDLVFAHIYAAEGAEGRQARRLRRRAEQLADATSQGSRDQQLLAEMAFAKVWMSWRAGSRNAAQRAERFTTRFAESGELVSLVWMIRGELAFAADEFDDAVTAFRFALGELDHPLYGYALWRTGHSYRRLGRTEEADQALHEVEQLGCREGAPALIVRLATTAASELGSGVRNDSDGVTRPAVCPAPGSETSGDEEEEGWRPEE
jgi:tetratricopeptide (TPR) repeat protein